MNPIQAKTVLMSYLPGPPGDSRLTPEQRMMVEIDDLKELQGQCESVLAFLDALPRELRAIKTGTNFRYRPWIYNRAQNALGDIASSTIQKNSPGCVTRGRGGQGCSG